MTAELLARLGTRTAEGCHEGDRQGVRGSVLQTDPAAGLKKSRPGL